MKSIKCIMLSLSLFLGCGALFVSCDDVSDSIENSIESSTIKGVYQNTGRVYDNVRIIRWFNLKSNGDMTLVETLNGKRFITNGKWVKLDKQETIKIVCNDGDRKGETHIINLTNVHYSDISFTFNGIDYTLYETKTAKMEEWLKTTPATFDYSYLFGTWTATPTYGGESANWKTLQVKSDYTFTLTTQNGEQTQTTTGTVGVGDKGKFLDLFAKSGAYAGQTFQGNVYGEVSSSKMDLEVYNINTDTETRYDLTK